MKVVLIDPVSSGSSLAEAFRERGAETFHVYQAGLRAAYDADPAPGGKLLHETFSETCSVLKRRGTEAVAAGSEAGVTLAEELAAALGLPHNALELAAARRDKLLMVRALEAAGVPAALTVPLTDEADLAAALARFGSEHYPVVVKPAASAGSDGLALCADADEVRAAVQALLGRTNLLGLRNDTVLLQEYLTGKQYVLNTVSRGGRHVVSDLLTTGFDEVEGKPIARNTILRRVLEAEDRRVVEYGLRCLDALGVTDGAAHTEIRLTDRGPLLVEVNSRLMGPTLPADPFVSAMGHTHATLFADAVLGAPAFDEFAARDYELDRYIGFVFMRARESGTLRSMPGLDRIRRLPTFHSFARLPVLGTKVKDPLLTTGSAGLAYFVGPDPEAIDADCEQLHAWEDAGLLFTMGKLSAEAEDEDEDEDEAEDEADGPRS